MKKMLALLVAIMMMAVPAMSMAAQQTTISFQHGTLAEILGLDETTTAVVNDLIDSVGLSVSESDVNGQASIALMLQGQPAVTLDFQIENDVLYIGSNILGEDVLTFSKAQLLELVDQMGLDEEESAQIKQVINAMFGDVDALAGLVNVNVEVPDLSATMAALLPVMSKAVTTEINESINGSDVATTKIEFIASEEDATNIVRTFLHDVMNSASGANMRVSLAQAGISEEEFFEMISAKGEVPVVIYLDAEDELVAITADMTLTAQDTDLTMNMDIKRVTVDGVQTIYCDYKVAQDDEIVDMDMSIAVVDENNADIVMNVAVEQKGEKQDVMSMTFKVAENNGNYLFDFVITVYTEEGNIAFECIVEGNENGGYAQIKPVDGDPYLTMQVKQEEVEELPALSNMNAVNLLNMDQNELTNYANTLVQNAQIKLVSVLQLLPESLLRMILSQTGM